jgi:hypothetical protein
MFYKVLNFKVLYYLLLKEKVPNIISEVSYYDDTLHEVLQKLRKLQPCVFLKF